MKILKVLLVLLLWRVSRTRSEECPEVTVLLPFYVRGNVTCNDKGTLQFQVYEDCPSDTMIFRVTDDYTISDCNGDKLITSTGPEFGLTHIEDAENSKNSHVTCTEFLTNSNSGKIYNGEFYFVDVNEYPPEPANNLGLVQSINVNENVIGGIYNFSYTDRDAEETQTMEASCDCQGDASIFSVEELGLDGNLMNYQLVASDYLDFENTSFFSLKVIFTSSDTRMNSSSQEQNFLIFVQDLGDSPPFFSEPVPFVEIEEQEPNGTLVFTVEAQDRDVGIDNDIQYAIIGGNDDGYFSIDILTGDVYIENVIDRETLDSVSFALQIQAKEVLQDGSQAPDPSETTQVTSVNILDINDNFPTFNLSSTTTQVEEFSEVQPVPSKNLDVIMMVSDFDEGLSGEYELTTNNENVKLNPTSGSGETLFEISILNSDNFNYEIQADDPNIVVEITATELGNSTHVSKINLTIILLDINDNIPTYTEDSYDVEMLEDTPPGTSVINATATDGDASPEYGEEFLVYYVLGCDELTVDSSTGEISLSETAQLDYEAETVMDCTLTVADMNATSDDSLSSQSSLKIRIVDVNDEVPVFNGFDDSAIVVENTDTGSEVATIRVTDRDTNASLVVTMEYESGTPQEVQEWFVLTRDDTSTANNYTGKIVIGTSPDRELSDEVVMYLRATDEFAELGDQETLKTLTITIEDLNDEKPQFTDDYSQLNYDEETPKDTIVLYVSATDPDLDDELTYILIDDLGYLKIDEATGAISVLNEVDRETIAFFQVELTVMDLANNSNTVQINVTVNDLNDNSPILDKEICAEPLSVSEDEVDGVLLTTVEATDADEGVHAEIVYILKNPNFAGSVNQYAPFVIDSQTGEITVNTSGDRFLDWERQSEWQLVIQAYDQCADAEPSCSLNHDECAMTVAVEDVNDNPPGDYTLSSGTEIITNEFLLQGEMIPNLEISALDPDEPNTAKSEISFQVSSMTLSDGTETDILFEAIDANRTSPENVVEYYCNLVATMNLTGLRNDYFILIQGSDAGDPSLQSTANFSLKIQDSNDMIPEFSYSECLVENDYTIVLLENNVEQNTPLPCNFNDSSAEPADIYIFDDDEPNTPNSEVDLRINLEDSIAVDGGSDNQLDAFFVFRYDEENENRFAIAVQENIDREKGSKYSLRLVAEDHGNVPQASYSWVNITVVDVSEFPPTFCENPPCDQTLYIKENTNISTAFLEAVDLDNGDDAINDVIYYIIIDYDVDAFVIPDMTVPAIIPRVDIDREMTESYYLLVMASNSASDNSSDDVAGTNQVLNISVTIVDENDETPTYDDVIYGDFLESGKNVDETTVAILEFEDKDLNETITYAFASPFQWSDGQNYTDPFRIEVIDNRTSKIVLNMSPQGRHGYCSFNVSATDKVSHSSTALAQVFVVTNEYVVLFYFLNDIQDVTNNEDNIEDIFTDVFTYTCVIDSIDQAVDSNNVEVEGNTIVSAHFIRQLEPGKSQRMISTKLIGNEMLQAHKSISAGDTGNKTVSGILPAIGNANIVENIVRDLTSYRNPMVKIKQKHLWKDLQTKEKLRREREAAEPEFELVPEEEIEAMGSKGTVAYDLDTQLSFIGLDLVRIGDTDTIKGPDYTQQITNLKIAIGSVSLFLGLVVILLTILYLVQTTKLKRQVRVYSTKSVVSPGGATEGPLPGSNLYSGESANPIYNLNEDDVKKATEDDKSISSWDSVLVGVEDNPQFAESSQQRSMIGSEQNGEITQPSSLINPFLGGHKINPLIDSEATSGMTLHLETQSVQGSTSFSINSSDAYDA